MEERLPCSPWWAAEWKALGEGKEWRKHVPLGPILFIYGYLAVMSVLGSAPVPCIALS